ncbi:MAG: nickel transporter, partial [Methanoregulaceae archaeon]|nr:nickel transporter [Methanoregulaceae archaeon]
LILAMDLKGGLVVHGRSGERAGYLPLGWGAAPTAEPVPFVRHIAPRFIYVADLDRISGEGSHDAVIHELARLVERCYADRGTRSPADMLLEPGIVQVVGTETATGLLSEYRGFLSVDVKDGLALPEGRDPCEILTMANEWAFEGCIILNISAVGTGALPAREDLLRYRNAYNGTLLYGGGVSGEPDLEIVRDSGFDGAIISTALHRGAVPLEWIRRGIFC